MIRFVPGERAPRVQRPVSITPRRHRPVIPTAAIPAIPTAPALAIAPNGTQNERPEYGLAPVAPVTGLLSSVVETMASTELSTEGNRPRAEASLSTTELLPRIAIELGVLNQHDGSELTILLINDGGLRLVHKTDISTHARAELENLKRLRHANIARLYSYMVGDVTNLELECFDVTLQAFLHLNNQALVRINYIDYILTSILPALKFLYCENNYTYNALKAHNLRISSGSGKLVLCKSTLCFMHSAME
jgi:hypothetical protein